MSEPTETHRKCAEEIQEAVHNFVSGCDCENCESTKDNVIAILAKHFPSDQPNSLDAAFAALGRAIYKRVTDAVSDNGGDEWCDDVMHLAEPIGLAQRVKFSPELHGRMNIDIEPGDSIWWWGHLPKGWEKDHTDGC